MGLFFSGPYVRSFMLSILPGKKNASGLPISRLCFVFWLGMAAKMGLNWIFTGCVAVGLLLAWAWPGGTGAQLPAPSAPGSYAVADTLRHPNAWLDRELALLERSWGVELGVYMQRVGDAHYFSYRERTPFQMASVYKLPIALHVLKLHEEGRLRLDSVLSLHSWDYCPGSGLLQWALQQGAVQRSVGQLLDLMLQESDNTATDILLGLAGGPWAVQQRMNAWGITGLRVDRKVIQLFADYTQRPLPLMHERSIAGLNQRYEWGLSAAERSLAEQRWRQDTLDTGTPLAYGQLWQRLEAGELLQPTTRQRLYQAMRHRHLGQARIAAALPAGAALYHKTGTFFGSCNDAALIDYQGHRYILVVLTRGAVRGHAYMEGVLARAADKALQAYPEAFLGVPSLSR